MRFTTFLFLFILLGIHPAFAQTEPDLPDSEEELQKLYEKNIRKSRINGVYIPEDVNDAIRELKRLSPPESLMEFKNADEELVKSKLHFGLGRWMIYNWNFYEGSRLSHLLKSMGISFPDDMAKFLIVSFHRHLNNRPLELELRAKEYADKRMKEQIEREKEGKLIREERIKKKNN